MVHKRSRIGAQKRDARYMGLQSSFNDRIRAEKVATTETREAVSKHLSQKHGFVFPHVLAPYESGNVLEDGLGRGVLQNTELDV